MFELRFQLFIRSLDKYLCRSLIIRIKSKLMTDIHKNIIRYYIEHELRYKKKCTQRDFLANGADLIDRLVEIVEIRRVQL